MSRPVPIGTNDSPTVMSFAELYRSTVDELSSWSPHGSARGIRRDFLEFADAGESSLRKYGGPAHFTASCLVFDSSASRVLLTLHRKAGVWMQFGGHLEPGDSSPAGAAAREAREESGIDNVRLIPGIWRLDRHALGRRFGKCQEHLDIQFVATVPDNARFRVSSESLDVSWFPIDRLPESIVPDLPPVIPDAATRVRAATAPRS